MKLASITILISYVVVFAPGCRQHQPNTLFEYLPSNESQVKFKNTIDEAKMPGQALNEFAYMGGGVGILDVNNDGLKDILFTGNQVSSMLYLNLGSNRFVDITKTAGLSTSDWITGVSIVDINADGFDDIYLCTFGKNLGSRAPNLLFVNQQNNTFKEQALEYGLADTAFSTQAAFFDYDKDGDLDMYLVNYMLNASYSANYLFPKNLTGGSAANDKLYRNNGVENGHPFFSDVSKEAGIIEDGYGLGVSVSDFNMDGYPDVFVSNDFVSNDDLWLNNKNGTFTNTLDGSTRHQSYSSMGCDAADIDNDEKIDFASVDMMPEDNFRKKQSFSFMNYERYQAERNLGYSPEFTRNVLQLNNGNYQKGDTAIPFFSEIGQLAGISETDWSWSILFADFDNDGHKDVHITNGIGRDFVNADFIQFSQHPGSGTAEQFKQTLRDKLEALDHVEIPNYLFVNNGDYTFSNLAESSGIGKKSMSNGAAYADLDNDGDLDLVVNNINKEAFILVNRQNQPGKPGERHSIGFILEGDTLNRHGIGAKVFVYDTGRSQLQEQFPVRGYLSAVDTKLLFGTGTNGKVDSVVVVWPDNSKQVLVELRADSVYKLAYKNAADTWQVGPNAKPKIFTEITGFMDSVYKHSDYVFDDYAEQRLLPQKYSQMGPFISTGDINKDGRTDFFIGAGFNSIGKLFTQTRNGGFAQSDLMTGLKYEEDEDSELFDADQDGDLDLLVTYGDMRFKDTSKYYQPRLYINDGNAKFTVDAGAIPSNVRTIAGCVASADYDGDGDLDLFIGGRVSKRYPVLPASYLLENRNGTFADVTNQICPELSRAGMVAAAQWADIDNDGHPDLIIAGEYMPIRFFKNNGRRLTEITASTGLRNMEGQWRSLIATDVDGDGDTDLIAGNLGSNCNYHTTPDYPMKLYAKDIDNNGSIDPVMFYYIKDEDGQRRLHPSINRDQLATQIPSIKKRFLLNRDFPKASVADIFIDKDGLQILTCEETRTSWLENLGSGKFKKNILPAQAQFAPVNAILCADMDGDGIKDILLAGNEYQADVLTGRYDASYGCFLKGMKDKSFKYVSYLTSGLKIDGDIKDMKLITTAGNEKIILVAVNDDYLKAFRINSSLTKQYSRDVSSREENSLLRKYNVYFFFPVIGYGAIGLINQNQTHMTDFPNDTS